MNSSNINREDFSNAENLIPSKEIKQETDLIENIECIDIDEIFPSKKEEEDLISVPVIDHLSNMNTCNECGIHAECIVKNQENGKEEYFCTKKCMILNSHKPTPCMTYSQLSTSSSSSESTPLPALPSSSSASLLMVLCDASSLFLRVCYTCSAIIQINDYSNLFWQARDFCNEKCLTNHQVCLSSYCIECKCLIDDANHCGKFFLRFGNSIRTFCSKICLNKYKLTINMCQFCDDEIPRNAQHKYFAPVTEYSSAFKQFCSINCLKSYCHYKLKLPYQNEAENYANCAVCNVYKFVGVKFQYKKSINITFCSEICFGKFQYTNKINVVKCCICNTLYENNLFQRYCLYDNGVKNFCTENCQTTYLIIVRYIVECNNCQVKKYNFDMIQKIFPNNQTIYACSFDCLKNFYKNMSRPIVSSGSKNEFKRLKNSMTSTMARNGSTVCNPIQNNTVTSMDIQTAHKQTQTLITLAPTPVQIHVTPPSPLNQMPVLFALPTFQPTSCKTQEEYTSKVKNILKELPKRSD